MAKYLEPLGPVTHKGIDVSRYQGDIDFARVRKDGISAVYIRSSLGSTYIDPKFEQNARNAQANGLLIGFYHYVTARSTSQAEIQARFFARTVRNITFNMRLAMDFESFGGLSKRTLNAVARTFMDTLAKESGKELVIYTGAYNARNLWDQSLAKDYPLWVAEYGPKLPEYNSKWPGWVGFQFSNKGSIDGIRGYVDLDQFTDGILLSNENPDPEEPENPTQPDQKLILITVQPGDTLTSIASKYGTTVSEIVRLNDIKDPNFIRAGEKLYVRVDADHPQAPENTYVVQPGDTLSGIAHRFSTTVDNLVKINNISNPDRIYPGQVIRLQAE